MSQYQNIHFKYFIRYPFFTPLHLTYQGRFLKCGQKLLSTWYLFMCRTCAVTVSHHRYDIVSSNQISILLFPWRDEDRIPLLINSINQAGIGRIQSNWFYYQPTIWRIQTRYSFKGSDNLLMELIFIRLNLNPGFLSISPSQLCTFPLFLVGNQISNPLFCGISTMSDQCKWELYALNKRANSSWILVVLRFHTLAWIKSWIIKYLEMDNHHQHHNDLSWIIDYEYSWQRHL